MGALLFYAIQAGLLGLSIHKKWWGAAAFWAAMLVWMLAMQVCTSITMIPHYN